MDSRLAELKLTLRFRKPVLVATFFETGADMDERQSGGCGGGDVVVSSVLFVFVVVDETEEQDCRGGLRM